MNTPNITGNTAPNPIRLTDRGKRWGAGLLLAAVGAAGFGVVHEAQSIRHENDLVAKLEQPQSKVANEIKTGQIDTDDITLVRAPESGSAFDVATDIVGNSQDPRQVSDILSFQTHGTNQVVEGQRFELPKSDVPSDSPYVVVQK